MTKRKPKVDVGNLTIEAALNKDKRSATYPKLGGMQHRHFAVIAGLIAQWPDAGCRADVAVHFADGLASANPRFDRRRFLRACNVAEDL